VTFAYLNLALDPYPALDTGTWGMDLIFCRNVLIYLDRQTVSSVAERLRRCLATDGWIVTAFQFRADAIGSEGDGADLDDSVSRRVKTGRLEVESCVFRQSRSRFYGRGGHNRGTPPESLAL